MTITLTKTIVTPEGVETIALTPTEIAEWQAASDAAEAARVQEVAAETWAAYQVQAQDLLDASDITFSRTLEAGIAWPQAWVNFRAALRVIVRAPNGDATQPLPVRPEYPGA